MAHYILTKRSYFVLLDIIKTAQEKLDETIKDKSESGAGQDSWHDEGFKIGVGEEITWSKRLRELQDILASAKVISPEEQCEIVKVGNGVIIEYENGNTLKFILEGYCVDTDNRIKRVSLYSPIGKLVFGCKINDAKELKGKGKIKIKKIILPSIAEKELFIN